MVGLFFSIAGWFQLSYCVVQADLPNESSRLRVAYLVCKWKNFIFKYLLTERNLSACNICCICIRGILSTFPWLWQSFIKKNFNNVLVSKNIITVISEDLSLLFVCQEKERNLGSFSVTIYLYDDASGLQASNMILK